MTDCSRVQAECYEIAAATRPEVPTGMSLRRFVRHTEFDYYYRMGMSPGIITELAQWESQTQDFQIAAIHDICILSTSMR